MLNVPATALLSFLTKSFKKITEKALDAEQGPNYMNLPTVLLIYLHSGKQCFIFSKLSTNAADLTISRVYNRSPAISKMKYLKIDIH